MALTLLPTAAFALDEITHSHAVSVDGADITWTAWDGSGEITYTGNTASVYLTQNVTRSDVGISIPNGRILNLCLNGFTVSGNIVTGLFSVKNGGTLRICDCSDTGKVHSGDGFGCVGVYNQGCFILESGTVEGTAVGVYNGDNNYTCTINGGAVTGKDGIYNQSAGSNAKTFINGGTVTGTNYGVSNNNSSTELYLSGAPTISGVKADIYTDDSTSYICADNGAETPTPYSGEVLSLGYPTPLTPGSQVVHHVTEATKDKFKLVDQSYGLTLNQTYNTLVITAPTPAHTHNGVTFTAWNRADSLPDAEGNYYLTTDVTLASTWETPEGKTVNLCLNGHSITGPGGDATVCSVSELTLFNCQDRQSVIDGGTGGTAVEARLGSLAFSGSGLIRLEATGRYSCALDIGIQRLGGPTLVATISDTVTLEVSEGASSALYVHESTNNKVRVSGAKVFGNSSTGVQVDCGSVEITDGTINGMPALYTHWQGTITVSGGRVATDTGGHAIEVMGPVSVTGEPTVFGPAVIIYASFSSGVQHGLLDAQGYTGSKKIDLMLQDTVPAKAAVGDIIVTNGTLSQFQWVSSRKFSLVADGANLKLGDPSAQPSHTHSWAAAWTTDETHHWHECTAQGCDVTANADKDGYGAHTEDNGTVTKPATNTETGVRTYKCSVCERVLHTEEIPMLTYSISGTVTDHESNNLSDVTVTLMRGNTKVAETTTGSNGAYSFSGVRAGTYNVVATNNDVTKTILVVLTDADATDKNVQMPDGKKNSVVEITGSNTPAVVVGGVDEIAEAQAVNPGETVTVKLTVEKKEESAAANATEIKQVAGGKTLDFLDLKLEKTVTGGTNDGTTDITDTQGKVLEIVVPYDFSGKQNVTVYRYHDGSAAALKLAESKAGGTFRMDRDKGLIHIYATKFSTYAIGYTASGGGNGGGGGGSSGGGGNGGGYVSPTTYPVELPASTPGGKVTSSVKNAASGTAVTLTLTPDPGYQISSIAVTDKTGRQITVTAKGNGTYSFIMPSGSVTVSAVFVKLASGYQNCPKDSSCPLWPYSDTNLGAWYHDSVHYCIENGLMSGYGNGLFGPNDNLSRAQFAQMLYNREGRPSAGGGNSFTDVLSGVWYTNTVIWAAARGIVSGYGDGRFGPNDKITREQLVVMLWRYAGSPSATEKELHFSDADKASGYALEALRWAAENGIINGYGNGQLDPEGSATRAQAAQMLVNFLEK